jgi:hypothetical protein
MGGTAVKGKADVTLKTKPTNTLRNYFASAPTKLSNKTDPFYTRI